MNHNELSSKINDRLDRLDRAVASKNVNDIVAQAKSVGGLQNIMGGSFPLSAFQRQRMRAIAHEIDKFDEGAQITHVAEDLRHLSSFGLR